ncbi:hypothetical protein Glove_140g95 [Diversispora epigaea]|nr:hypothetical protein Glove_140g95 [Diversispora epigaea]
MSLPNTPGNKLTRYGLLGVFGFMEGLSIGPVVKYALSISISNNILINACVVTGLMFSAFTLSAMFTNKAYFMYLGGILGSVLSLLLWTSFINSFIGSKFIFDIEIYVGLFMFCGYVIYDTQLIIYRATELGVRDEVSDALTLFIDLVGIFVRILLIFSDKSEKSNQKQKERRSRRKAGYSGQ